MSGGDNSEVTEPVEDGASLDRPPAVTAQFYREEEDVAAVVTVGDATLVVGYAERLIDRLEADAVVPDHYVALSPAPPAWYLGAMREAGAWVHDTDELRTRADGLYADGFSVAPGVGVLPCRPEHTIVVRFRDRPSPVDLLVSNAPSNAAVGDSLVGALPLFGSVTTDDGVVTGDATEGGTLRAVGTTGVLTATGEDDRARAAGVDVGTVEFPDGRERVDLWIGPTGDVETIGPGPQPGEPDAGDGSEDASADD